MSKQRHTDVCVDSGKKQKAHCFQAKATFNQFLDCMVQLKLYR